MTLTVRVAVAVAVAWLCWPAAAWADWVVSPFVNRGVEEIAAETFQDLFEGELSARAQVAVQRAGAVLREPGEAASFGRDVAAERVVYGSLSALGSRIIVSATVVDPGSGVVLGTARMTATRLEDLEPIAARLAEAIATGKDVDETAELGLITKAESTPKERRKGDHAFGFRLGGVGPISGYSDSGFGVLIDLSYVYEANDFAVEPRVGFRFSAERSGDAEYFQLPIDIGAYGIVGQSDVAFIGGGGVGIRYHWERRPETIVIGGILTETHRAEVSDDGWGFGMFARVGALFFRTYSVRMAVTLEYDISFIELHEHRYPMALIFGVALHL
jgi:TolB-like protein